jgi:hypothetical protein
MILERNCAAAIQTSTSIRFPPKKQPQHTRPTEPGGEIGGRDTRSPKLYLKTPITSAPAAAEGFAAAAATPAPARGVASSIGARFVLSYWAERTSVPPGASRWEEKSGLAAASRAAGAAMDSGFRGGTSHLGVGPLRRDAISSVQRTMDQWCFTCHGTGPTLCPYDRTRLRLSPDSQKCKMGLTESSTDASPHFTSSKRL